MTSDITWGPEISVDGKRPEWLEDDTSFLAIFDDGFEWKEPYQAAQIQAWRQEGEGFVKSIRLPADHPHYATQSHPTAPIPSEVGPEVIGMRNLREARRQDAALWDRMVMVVREYATGNNDSVIERGDGVPRSTFDEARAIVGLLPELVDGDLVEARRLAVEHTDGWGSRRSEDVLAGRCDDGVAVPALLAAIKRGRALEKGDQ